MSNNLIVICHSQTVNFKCKLCDKTFQNSGELATHLVKLHTKETELNVKCDQCDYVTDNVSNLVKHIVCQYCDFGVKDKKDIMHTMAQQVTLVNVLLLLKHLKMNLQML